MKTLSINLILFYCLTCVNAQTDVVSYEEKNLANQLFVFSDGRSAEEIIQNIKVNGFEITGVAEEPALKITTTCGKFYKLGIIYGNQSEQNARKEAKEKGWKTPPAEISLLLYEKITDDILDKLKLTTLTIMHEPIRNYWEQECLFEISHTLSGTRILHFTRTLDSYLKGDIEITRDKDIGFVFLIP